jgi:hypothetical protein
MSTALESYTAANLAMAWHCRVDPTETPGLWIAIRDQAAVAAVYIAAGPGWTMDSAERIAAQVTPGADLPAAVTVLAVSATSALWCDGKGVPRELAMPVPPWHPPREPLWYCETCKGRHPLRQMKACRSGELVP